MSLSNHVIMDHAAIKEEPTTTPNFAESGNNHLLHSTARKKRFAEALAPNLGEREKMQTLYGHCREF